MELLRLLHFGKYLFFLFCTADLLDFGAPMFKWHRVIFELLIGVVEIEPIGLGGSINQLLAI